MATPNSSLELTPRGKVMLWLAGMAAGAAWLGGDDNARLAAAMLAAPLVVDFVAKQRQLHHTRIRVAPRRTVAGAIFEERLHITHQGRRPLRHCQLHEPRSMRHEPPVLLPTLPPFEETTVTTRQRSMVRSHVLERVYVLESQWPLGMFATRSIVSSEADLITVPARIQLRAELLDAANQSDEATADRSDFAGSEFHALREHQPDEEARGVHALRSASIGTLVRRVTRGRLPRTIGVVLDLRRAPGQPRGLGLQHFEWSLKACATLVELLHARAAEVRVLVIDSEPEAVDVRTSTDLEQLLTLLSEVGISHHHTLSSEHLGCVETLVHCYWIPAGSYLRAPEIRALRNVTIISEDHG